MNLAIALLYSVTIYVTSRPFTFETTQRMKWYVMTFLLGLGVRLTGLAEIHNALIIHNTAATTVLIYHVRQWPIITEMLEIFNPTP